MVSLYDMTVARHAGVYTNCATLRLDSTASACMAHVLIFHTGGRFINIKIQPRSVWVTPSGTKKTSAAERLADIRDRPDNFRLLERVPIEAESVPVILGKRSENDTVVTFLDTETTSLDIPEARIIELAMLRCRYDPDGRLVEISDRFDGLEDPGISIPENVVDITGITDDMVRGQKLDSHTIREWLGEDPLIVAHNARFDRPIFERRFPEMGRYRWACSVRGIPWYDMGYRSSSLPLLLEQEGWFFDAHRAHADCLAVSWMLHSVPGSLQYLSASTADRLVVTAGGSTYAVRSDLNKRGYKFNGGKKNWTRAVEPADLDSEIGFLRRLSHRILVSHAPVTAHTAYKE